MKDRWFALVLVATLAGCNTDDDDPAAGDAGADAVTIDGAIADAAIDAPGIDGPADAQLSPDPLTPEQIATVCEQQCGHQFACGQVSNQAACEADCVADAPQTSWMRADAVFAVVVCQVMQPCDNPIGDGCFAACTPTPAHEAFEDQCLETMAPCGTPAQVQEMCSVRHIVGVSDSGLWCLVLPAIMDEFTACVADGMTCQAAGSCIQQVMAAHGINFG